MNFIITNSDDSLLYVVKKGSTQLHIVSDRLKIRIMEFINVNFIITNSDDSLLYVVKKGSTQLHIVPDRLKIRIMKFIKVLLFSLVIFLMQTIIEMYI